MKTRASDLWLPATRAARVLGSNMKALPRIAKAAGIRTQRLPTMPTRYHRLDVERVAAESVNTPELAAAGS